MFHVYYLFFIHSGGVWPRSSVCRRSRCCCYCRERVLARAHAQCIVYNNINVFPPAAPPRPLQQLRVVLEPAAAATTGERVSYFHVDNFFVFFFSPSKFYRIRYFYHVGLVQVPPRAQPPPGSLLCRYNIIISLILFFYLFYFYFVFFLIAQFWSITS